MSARVAAAALSFALAAAALAQSEATDPIAEAGRINARLAMEYLKRDQLQTAQEKIDKALLQKGVDVWIDLATPINYPITIADQNGSYASIELTGPMIVSLQGGAFLNVAVTAANGDRVQFQLSLKGFTNAFAKL